MMEKLGAGARMGDGNRLLLGRRNYEEILGYWDIDDGENDALIAAAADVDAHLAIRGMHAVRDSLQDLGLSTPSPPRTL